MKATAEDAGGGSGAVTSERYGRYALFIFVLVLMLNLIDRQILSILAEDVKRDLKLNDAELGFLYGTAFAVFYSLFGIPLGRLADATSRVRLMAAGLALWSAMTAFSGVARNGGQLAAARIGVGIGEATASPCAYSLISDYFPREKRASALAVYASGSFLGAGLSLGIGGAIVVAWNGAFPDGGPLGLVGWQAAFLAVGIPGLLLACWVATLREPLRGVSDGIISVQQGSPYADFMRQLLTVVPPFTLIGAMQRGPKALAVNLGFAALVAATAALLTSITGNPPQWIAVAIAFYAIFSWASSLKAHDLPTYTLIWGTPTFIQVTMVYGLLHFMVYAAGFWGAPYAERVLGESKATIGWWVGGGNAAAGFLGVIIGGRIADRMKRAHPSGRIKVMIFGTLGLGIPLAIAFTTASPVVFYIMFALMSLMFSIALPPGMATTQDLVLPRMRATATATFMLGQSVVGLAFGPFISGYVSGATGSLSTGVLSVLVALPVCALLLLRAHRNLPDAERTVLERVRAAGEPV